MFGNVINIILNCKECDVKLKLKKSKPKITV